MAQKVAQPIFRQNQCITLAVENSVPQIWVTSRIFKKLLKTKQSPKRRTFFQSGVDVMITIFCDFSQFLAKKLAFFLNTNVMINFFQNLALFRVKNANFFAKFFWQKYLKNHNIGPWSPWL
jgi:hypothetical protein